MHAHFQVAVFSLSLFCFNPHLEVNCTTQRVTLTKDIMSFFSQQQALFELISPINSSFVYLFFFSPLSLFCLANVGSAKLKIQKSKNQVSQLNDFTFIQCFVYTDLMLSQVSSDL